MDKESNIVSYLKEVGAVYEDPVSAWQIANACGYRDDRAVRKIILRAIKKLNKPIGANTHGFYLIRTTKEMQRYLNSLLQRQIKISERIDTVYNAYHKRYPIQKV